MNTENESFHLGSVENGDDGSFSSGPINGKWISVRRDAPDKPYVFSLEDAGDDAPKEDNKNIAFISMDMDKARKAYDFGKELLLSGMKSDDVIVEVRNYINNTLNGGTA